jgi:hypothetical protein
VRDEPDQDLLAGILGILRVAEEPQGQAVHRMLEPPHQLRQRIPVTVGGPARQGVDLVEVVVSCSHGTVSTFLLQRRTPPPDR